MRGFEVFLVAVGFTGKTGTLYLLEPPYWTHFVPRRRQLRGTTICFGCLICFGSISYSLSFSYVSKLSSLEHFQRQRSALAIGSNTLCKNVCGDVRRGRRPPSEIPH